MGTGAARAAGAAATAGAAPFFTAPSIDLRCFDVADFGGNWILRCKRCAAAWSPSKDGYDPTPMIEHVARHQPRRTRLQELQRQLAAIDVARLNVEIDLLQATTPTQRQKLRRERATFSLWHDTVEHSIDVELEQLARAARAREAASAADEAARIARARFENKIPAITAARNVDALHAQAREILPPQSNRTSVRHRRGPYKAGFWHNSIVYL